ncbi:sigma factor-like helix-turn-helix DNA-binding protein [Sphingobacterium kitahiroshimense]|uniref:sigma factor-like helix-turn-helix DNA-binding protein n=1 Tax=Sphingobacterium kitahiroshimense TaxID=470446 RepID=UPI003209A274
MEYKELDQQINQIIDALPSSCQEVFKLSRLEHLSHKEISEKLVISTKTVIDIYVMCVNVVLRLGFIDFNAIFSNILLPY